MTVGNGRVADQVSEGDYLEPRMLAAIDSLELRARMVVQGLMIGLHGSYHQGVSVEFSQHRPYTTGDDIRHIDWKVFGRTDKLYLKQYQKETNLRVFILVDISGSMGFSSFLEFNWRKFDVAATLAATLSYLAIQQQDRVALVLFSDEVESITRLSNSKDHWRAVLAALNDASFLTPGSHAAKDAKSTDFSRVFDQVNAKLNHRSLIVLISDLFDPDPAALEHSLAQLRHHHHDLVLLHTLDNAELTFPFRSPVEFEGLESEGRIKINPAGLRQSYLERFNHYLQEVERVTRRFRFDYIRVDTSKSLAATLRQFIALRTASISKGR